MCRAPLRIAQRMVANARAPDPLLPHSRTNPIGATKEIRETERIMTKHLASVKKWLMAELDRIPTEAVGNALTVNKRYEYLISLTDLRRIVGQLNARMRNERFMQMVTNRVTSAYAQGAGAKALELARLTDDYTRTVTSVLASQPFIRRSSLVGARVFEEMEGFAGTAAARLGRTLMAAVEAGTNPRAVARQISADFAVSRSRARTIARTEITGALRRGRLDEARDAQERLGIRTKELWFSALSDTTRDNHAERHGNTYTADEVVEFYSEGAESINCKCVTASVLVDDDGNPVSDRLVQREQDRRREYMAGRE
jgi:SPP1 gp7 family putative phage head morphogenesis protein